MKLFDEIIRQTKEVLAGQTFRSFSYEAELAWPCGKSLEMVLLRDAAFELGGDGKDSVNYTCITDTRGVIPKNEILLYGPDLSEIRGDVSFARITHLSVKDMDEMESDELYRFIREMEYVKYHMFPRGYMVRVSAKSSREQARVSRQAIRRGISFAQIGNAYIENYLKNPKVKAVQMIFVTDRESLRKLQKLAGQANEITLALDHILQGLEMNCAACDLKAICTEVEGMRKMHREQMRR